MTATDVAILGTGMTDMSRRDLSLNRPAKALPMITSPSSWGATPESPSASWVAW